MGGKSLTWPFMPRVIWGGSRGYNVVYKEMGFGTFFKHEILAFVDVVASSSIKY